LPIPPNRGQGLGFPQDPYYTEGYRDYGQGEPRQKDVVFDPAADPNAVSPEQRVESNYFFDRLKDFLNKNVFFSKRPAFVEPPFFAKPLIKTIGVTGIAGSTTALFDRVIPDRHRAMVTMFGIDLAPLLPLTTGLLSFWFDIDGTVLPVFDDQSPIVYTPLVMGQTTVIPGSLENPVDLLQYGLAFQVKGMKRLQVFMRNLSLSDVTVRGVMGYYQYPLSPGSQEFEGADIQL
jgi:hypothetical protein